MMNLLCAMSTKPALTPRSRKRIVVLISGNGSNLQAIIDACAEQRIAGQIVGVISNRPAVYGLMRAELADIPTFVVDHTAFLNREQFDQALMQQIDQLRADLVVLAGFMRILTAGFVAHYHGRMINIHPSLLPAYKGTHTHERAIADGVNEHGCSVHFVTADLDSGAVIAQATVSIELSDTPEQLATRVLTQEHQLYPQVLTWFCEDRLKLEGEQAYLDQQVLEQPLRLEFS